MSVERRFDSSGNLQFVRRTTQEEIDRRDGWIAKLYRRGHTTHEISEALGVGHSTVSTRLTELFPGRAKRPKGSGPVGYACPWRNEDLPVEHRFVPAPVVPQESRWRQSRIIGMAQMLNDEYRESNFSNILANQVTAAGDHGDSSWQLEALAVISAAIEKLERARRVLTDDAYRAACRDTLEGVEQMRHRQHPSHPPLRALP